MSIKPTPSPHKIDELIRLGLLTEARKTLFTLLSGPLPRKELANLANLCRRLGLPMWGLRILNPFVYPKNKLPLKASPEELMEYGASLVQLGSVNEAQRVLKKVEGENPVILFHLAMAAMKVWDYQKARDKLEAYIQKSQLKTYDLAIALVNILAADIYLESFEKAGALLTKLKNIFLENKFSRLQSNVRELELQLHVRTRNWEEAERILSSSPDQAFAANFTEDSLYWKKWVLIYHLQRFPEKKAQGIKELGRLRGFAHELCDWETVRDCDYYIAVAQKDKKLLEKIYAGTPNTFYRQRTQRALSDLGVFFKGKTEWSSTSSTSKKKLGTLNFSDFTWKQQPLPFKRESLLGRCLWELISDAYSSPSMGQLHEKLFPERIYHPDSSPLIIHQTLRRLRQEAKNLKIPLTVEVRRGFVQCQLTQEVDLIIPFQNFHEEMGAVLKDFRNFSSDLDFRLIDLADYLNLSARQALRIIAKPLGNGKLVKLGKGRRRRYKFAA